MPRPPGRPCTSGGGSAAPRQGGNLHLSPCLPNPRQQASRPENTLVLNGGDSPTVFATGCYLPPRDLLPAQLRPHTDLVPRGRPRAGPH